MKHYKSLTLIAIAILAFAFVVFGQDEVPVCETQPNTCTTIELPYPNTGTYRVGYVLDGTEEYIRVEGEQPNQRILVSFQPPTSSTDRYWEYWWAARAGSDRPPSFNNYIPEKYGCQSFQGYGMTKKERICLWGLEYQYLLPYPFPAA